MAELQHIAFIMDGNRRWAKALGNLGLMGHKQGTETVRAAAQACLKKGIKYVTFWALSTENLKERSRDELSFLFSLLEQAPKIIEHREFKGKVRFVCIGDIGGLPLKTQKVMRDLEKRTRANSGLTVIGAVNYGGRDELARAVKKLAQKKLKPTEQNIAACLDTVGIPDPDLIIRTGARSRLSGFMPWQTVYSELYFTKTLWPDFNEKELDKAIKFFSATQRNFGK